MSDPFDVLREAPTDDTSVNVAAIKSRARSIQRRRVTALGGAAAAVLLIATIGVFVRPDQRTAELASRDVQPQSGETAADTATTVEDSSGSATKSRGAGTAGASAPQTSNAPEPAPMRVSPGAAGEASSVGSDLEFTLQIKEGSLTNRGAEFTLKACNPGTGTARREFSNSQRYDFRVLRDEELMWRWSDGKTFAQVTGVETWKPGECKTYTERWDGMTRSGGPAPSGRYIAVGEQTTQRPESAKPKSFCLDLC